MKNLLIIVSLLAASTTALAQNPMSLSEAMQYAVENSTDVAIQAEANESTHYDKVEAVAGLFPSLSASSSIYNSYGRSIDPETNTYTTVGNVSNSYSVSTYLTVFSGLKNINELKASRLKCEMGGHSMQQAKDAVALSVMQLYFDVIYYAQSVELVEQQKAAAEEVFELTTKQEGLGVKSAADVALSASQVASYDLMLTQQQNLHSQALLNLKEAMNYPFDEELILSDNISIEPITTATIFNIESNPEYQAAASQVEVSRTNLKIARGSYAPTFAVGAGYNNYYYASLADDYTPIQFSEQFKTNYGYYVGASLSIPIFSNLSYRSSVARSRHSLRTAELELHKTELRITKAAREALLSRDNSLKEQASAEAKVEAATLANRAVLRKFEQGVASFVDLQSSANELLQAKAEELRARLNYHKECIMVEYYFNGQI